MLLQPFQMQSICSLEVYIYRSGIMTLHGKDESGKRHLVF